MAWASVDEVPELVEVFTKKKKVWCVPVCFLHREPLFP